MQKQYRLQTDAIIPCADRLANTEKTDRHTLDRQTGQKDRLANIRQTDWQTKDRQSRKHWTDRLANTGRTDGAVVCWTVGQRH